MAPVVWHGPPAKKRMCALGPGMLGAMGNDNEMESRYGRVRNGGMEKMNTYQLEWPYECWWWLALVLPYVCWW